MDLKFLLIMHANILDFTFEFYYMMKQGKQKKAVTFITTHLSSEND